MKLVFQLSRANPRLATITFFYLQSYKKIPRIPNFPGTFLPEIYDFFALIKVVNSCFSRVKNDVCFVVSLMSHISHISHIFNQTQILYL